MTADVLGGALDQRGGHADRTVKGCSHVPDVMLYDIGRASLLSDHAHSMLIG